MICAVSRRMALPTKPFNLIRSSAAPFILWALGSLCAIAQTTAAPEADGESRVPILTPVTGEEVTGAVTRGEAAAKATEQSEDTLSNGAKVNAANIAAE